MEWFSWVGGSAGLVALIKVGIDLFMAKSGRTKVDIGNMREMIDEAHKMYDEATERYTNLVHDFDSYKAKADAKIDKVMSIVNRLERTVTQAYRCRYPENIQDCPVVKSYEEKHACEHCINDK